jgi:hypothetical protein
MRQLAYYSVYLKNSLVDKDSQSKLSDLNELYRYLLYLSYFTIFILNLSFFDNPTIYQLKFKNIFVFKVHKSNLMIV